MGDAALAFANKPLWSDRDAVTTSYVGWPEAPPKGGLSLAGIGRLIVDCWN
jgi:hypothetical protein